MKWNLSSAVFEANRSGVKIPSSHARHLLDVGDVVMLRGSKAGERSVYEIEVTLTSVRSDGRYVGKNKAGERITFAPRNVYAIVSSGGPAESGYEDEGEERSNRKLWIVVGGAAVLLAGGVAYWLWRRAQQQAQASLSAPPASPQLAAPQPGVQTAGMQQPVGAQQPA